MTPAAQTSPSIRVDLALGVSAALEQLPAAAGVAQILGDDDRSLVIGRPANLRRWLASHLGRAVVKKGQRPPTDLTPVACTVRFEVATSGFQQRLRFERLMSLYVPTSARRDLKIPAYLHLDSAERFPRVTSHVGGQGRPHLFGPFRDRRAADRARDGLHKRVPLRPCDFKFEPHPELSVGLSCLYAQVRTCAAPCLSRVGEDQYRALAHEAISFLAEPARRADDPPPWLPAYVAPASARAVVAEPGTAGLELYPVSAGSVDEESSAVAGSDAAAALAALRWRAPESPGRDEAWLASWLYERKRRGVYVVVDPTSPESAAAAMRAAV